MATYCSMCHFSVDPSPFSERELGTGEGKCCRAAAICRSHCSDRRCVWVLSLSSLNGSSFCLYTTHSGCSRSVNTFRVYQGLFDFSCLNCIRDRKLVFLFKWAKCLSPGSKAETDVYRPLSIKALHIYFLSPPTLFLHVFLLNFPPIKETRVHHKLYFKKLDSYFHIFL